MDFIRQPAAPPRRRSHDGHERRVGVEIEFAAVSSRQGAEVVRSLFGGTVREEDPHRHHVEGAELGDFTCEIDTQYAHRPKGASAASEDALEPFRVEMRRLFGDIGALVLPCEVVCPPIPWHDLTRLDALVDALRAAGAEGTRSSAFYAFGAQLNPEVPSTDPADLLAVLRAYLLVSPWLRMVMGLDVTRRLTAFADPFPEGWSRRILDPDYAPDLGTLIDDHLAANATRNRELDALPLFAWLDAARVHAKTPDPRINPRPTWHYRLPDADLGAEGWSLSLEWNRWLVVERLAEDPDLLARMSEAWRARKQGWLRDRWAMECSQWLLLALGEAAE